jgi:hypothetical protein
MDELGKLIKEGVAHAGMEIAGEHDSELGCLMSLVGQARDGDVVAIMTHQDRELLGPGQLHGAATLLDHDHVGKIAVLQHHPRRPRRQCGRSRCLRWTSSKPGSA